MKKSVVIIIAIIFVLAIALVNFLGVNYKTFDEVVYVESIKITNEGIKTNSKGEKSVVFFLDENGHGTFDIQCEITPDVEDRDTIFSNIRISYDAVDGIVVDNETGTVTFDLPDGVKALTIVVKLLPKDGSDCSDSLKIIGVRK